MTKKLTIIIPVFNGANYIIPCLSAIEGQLTADVEVIIVNDGSTDETGHLICSTFPDQIKGGSFIYIETPNSGVSAARNLGVARSIGTYIAFVDADDTVLPGYVASILAATAEDVCIIEFGYKTIDSSGNIINDNRFLHTAFGLNPASRVIDQVFKSARWYPFIRVFKRRLLEQTPFPIGVRFCEDLIAFSQIYMRSERIYSINAVLYAYMINPKGATRNISPGHAKPLIEFYRGIKDRRGFPIDALKMNVAYAIRRCSGTSENEFGRLPIDIFVDLLYIAGNPRTWLKMSHRIPMHAIAGSFVSFVKRFWK